MPAVIGMLLAGILIGLLRYIPWAPLQDAFFGETVSTVLSVMSKIGGHEEKNLFRFLFQTNQFGGMDMGALMENPALSGILLLLTKRVGCDADQAREMFLALFVTAHGLASLLANNAMEYDEEQCRSILENGFLGMLASRKGL